MTHVDKKISDYNERINKEIFKVFFAELDEREEQNREWCNDMFEKIGEIE